MIAYAALPMSIKTCIATALFLTMITGICTCIFVGKKQGRLKQVLLVCGTAMTAAMLLLYASIIPAERAKADIPAVSLWFAQLPLIVPLLFWAAVVVFLIMVIAEENSRRRTAITASSIKESLDQLQTGLCFSYPNGLLMLTNHRMNELSHAIFGIPLQNAKLFWEALMERQPVDGVTRFASGDHPEFRLPDGSCHTFHREDLGGIIQIAAADTTQQHLLVAELQNKHQALEEMNARIRSYGDKVDEYVIARERLETRINLHGFLGQALLMTRHHLQYESGDAHKIINIWQRHIDVLRLEAEPQAEMDSIASLKNAAAAVDMQVHVSKELPPHTQLRKLIAVTGAEMLTNAVRHANAQQLWIDAEETDTEYVVRYLNNGTAPDGPIKEGGGLSTVRRKIEAAGGRMEIQTTPRFMLTIIFEKGGMMDV